jgi:NTF2-like protein (DUF6841)
MATQESAQAQGAAGKAANPATMSDDSVAEDRREVTSWFFEDYLPRWVAVAAGTSPVGLEFILGYWDTPLHVTGQGQAFWCRDDASVVGLLNLSQAPLRESGYSHTTVLDRRVFAYSSVGAAIEVIFSRRRADETEVQRQAVHFEVAKSTHGWRVVGIQSVATTMNALDDVWPRLERHQ